MPGCSPPFGLTGVVVTADALHTQREHVRFHTRDKQAHYLLVVKNNQPSLSTAPRSLPWSRVTARHAARSRGHGRRELRVVKALTVDGLELDIPGAVQAARIMRFGANARTGRLTRKTIYAITDLPSTQASPQQLGEPARSHWGIEDRLHFVRDTIFAEDASRIRTGRGPENMATLRNLAVSTLRRAGHPEHRRRPPACLLPALHPPAGPPRHQLTSTASDHTRGKDTRGSRRHSLRLDRRHRDRNLGMKTSAPHPTMLRPAPQRHPGVDNTDAPSGLEATGSGKWGDGYFAPWVGDRTPGP
ncbi:ISAs1 family transposase [Streptomyces sp. NPDC004609]|uniref:ISAs1 family transposase n=1 Tax=Streptomyces sp. NPDC004609 TaxID=3364704 RepID=UPI00367AEC79